jgi:hypothetical protein
VVKAEDSQPRGRKFKSQQSSSILYEMLSVTSNKEIKVAKWTKPTKK